MAGTDARTQGSIPPMTHSRLATWSMIGLAALAQNCALGVTFGSFGPLLPSLVREYDVSTGIAATAIGSAVLVMSLLSPLVGRWLARGSVRVVLIMGALMDAAGFALLAVARDITEVILIYAFFIGTGTCMLGALPASTLVSNWVVENRGRVLGLINMPILLFCTPPVAAFVLGSFGMRELFAGLAGLFVCCALAMTLVIDRAPRNMDEAETRQSLPHASITSSEILMSRSFWLLSLGVGILAGTGTMITTHIVPLAVERSFSLEKASWLLSAFAAAGFIGAPLFGSITDRLGTRRCLAFDAFILIFVIGGMIFAHDYWILLTLVVAAGICINPVLALHGAAIAEFFGASNVAAVFGMSYLPKLLFIFGSAPLAGFLFDLTGSYQLPLAVHMTAFIVAVIGFLLIPTIARPPSRQL